MSAILPESNKLCKPQKFYESRPDMDDAEEFVEDLETWVRGRYGSLSMQASNFRRPEIERSMIKVFRQNVEGPARK